MEDQVEAGQGCKVTPKVGDRWYRVEGESYSILNEWDEPCSSRHELASKCYQVVKVTPKGVWVSRLYGIGENRYLDEYKRFIRTTAKKWYARPSEVDALQDFVRRKRAQARILSSRLAVVEQFEAMALAKLRQVSVSMAA